MIYIPAADDRITVRRTPSIHGGTGVMTGTVLAVLTIGGVEGILDFKCDQGGHVYLATTEQMAEIGVTQTIEPMPTETAHAGEGPHADNATVLIADIRPA